MRRSTSPCVFSRLGAMESTWKGQEGFLGWEWSRGWGQAARGVWALGRPSTPVIHGAGAAVP